MLNVERNKRKIVYFVNQYKKEFLFDFHISLRFDQNGTKNSEEKKTNNEKI